MYISYDEEADAVLVRLRAPRGIVRGDMLDEQRIIHYLWPLDSPLRRVVMMTMVTQSARQRRAVQRRR